uniref:Uncharacterized protein n=1 Tax=uncultured marine virus TaxID=186617 RepID=A0A0F7LC31_9VIRU|nr:hypothetical protein [uncultured marine virus]
MLISLILRILYTSVLRKSITKEVSKEFMSLIPMMAPKLKRWGLIVSRRI